MIRKIYKKNGKLNLTGLIVLVALSMLLVSQIYYKNPDLFPYDSNNSKKYDTESIPKSSDAVYYNNVPWLTNADFSTSPIDPWTSSTSGDTSDVMASSSSGQADYLVLGELGRKEISNVFTDPSQWTLFSKSDYDNLVIETF